MMKLAEVSRNDRALRGVPEPVRCARARSFLVPVVWIGQQRGVVAATHHAERARRARRAGRDAGNRSAATATTAPTLAPDFLSGVRVQLHRRSNRHRHLPELR
ncbi:MAG: hypothetical protein ACFCVC_03060 [Acidimicrobiia bacterium]